MLRRLVLAICVELSMAVVLAGCDDIHPVVIPTVVPTSTVTSSPSPTPENTPTPTPLDVARGCTQTGGTVTTAQCCGGVDDFPDLCDVGACSCALEESFPVTICDCGPGKCFDGDDCVGEVSPQDACRFSGGTVTTGSCCISVGDFPDTCGIGACGCAPSSSRTAQLCTCPESQCFDGGACVAR